MRASTVRVAQKDWRHMRTHSKRMARSLGPTKSAFGMTFRKWENIAVRSIRIGISCTLYVVSSAGLSGQTYNSQLATLNLQLRTTRPSGIVRCKLHVACGRFPTLARGYSLFTTYTDSDRIEHRDILPCPECHPEGRLRRPEGSGHPF